MSPESTSPEVVVSETTPAKKIAPHYAIIRTGGKQYRVSPGQRITIEKLDGAVGEAVTFSDVLLLKAEEKITVGTPVVAGAQVSGKIVVQGRGEKVTIYKKRRRKGYEKKQGHRQEQTVVLIEKF